MSSKETGCKNAAKVSIESHPFGLDDILIKIGQFGKFQLRVYCLSFALVIFHAILKYEFIFTASTVVFYRCRVPECDDGLESSYEKPWVPFSIPKASSGQLDKCHRFKTFNSTIDDGSGQNSCHAGRFNQSSRIDCGEDFIFRDEEVTISNDFKVFCTDEWKLAMVGSINNFGQFIGIPLGGYLSDRYGRSTVMAWGSALSTVMGILRSFSPNYYIFVLLGFLDNLFGSAIFGIAFVLALEFVGPSIRVHACTLVPMFNSLGRVLLAFVAKSFHNWRVVERIFYIPALGFLSLSWILPESVRWLLSREEEEKAIQILRKAAKINKRKLSDASIEKLLQANRKNLLGIDSKAQKFPIGDAFRAFPWRIMNISLCWFTNVFTFLGLSLNLGLLGGNKYDNFMYLSFIEIPGIWLPAVTMNRYGRKASQCGYLFLSGVSIMAMNFFASASNDSLRLILYLLGKMSITASFQVLYIFTSEIFPTNSRSTLGSFCSMIGRFGAMVAPQTPLLAKYYTSAPAILFACSAFLSGSLVLFLPETNNTVLPTTLQDAQKIGQKEINVKPETHTELEIQEKLLTSKA